MKILVLSDRMLGGHSGYSTLTYEMCTRFAGLGHSVAHIPMGMANKMGRQVSNKVLIYESGDQAFGEDVAVSHYLDFKADMLITNKEPWVFQDLHKWAINFVPIAVIDHSPLSGHITSRLRTAFKVIAQSQAGEEELRRENVECTYIPVGVRSDIYRPLPKDQCKKAFFFEPDDFVIGMVALNRARKMIPHMLRGYKLFLEQNPDIKNAHLFLWTNILPRRPPADLSQGVADVGVHLIPEIEALGIGKEPNDVRWIEPHSWQKVEDAGGIPILDPTGPWDMTRLYNAMDVNLLCSGGEGAGLPYLEAGCCGVPSVYTHYAAAPEYAGPYGEPVHPSDYVIINTPGTRHAIPNILQMAAALKKVYDADREKLGKRVRMYAARYDWQRVIQEYWVPFFEECAKELYPKVSASGVGTWA